MPKRSIINKKTLILLASLLALVSAIVAITVAYFTSRTEPINNDFTYATVSCEVVQDQSALHAEHIAVKNTSDTKVYVRAFVTVNYVSLSDPSAVYGTAPVLGDDYMITLGATDWVKGSDGFYYYTKPLEEGAVTTYLIESLTPILAAPDGYKIAVQTVAMAIQAEPDEAVKEAWGATVSGGVLTPR